MWALVHSKRRTDVEKGLQLADALIQSDDMDDDGKKDLVYFCCVAKYKLGKYVESRAQLDEFLKVWTSCCLEKEYLILVFTR